MWWLYRHSFRSQFARTALVLCSGVLLAAMADATAQESTPAKLTQLQLQSELMSFEGRLTTFLAQSVSDPKLRANTPLLADQIFITASAETIAASPNPGVGLLDMVVLVTLGRMIYEEHHHKQYGDLVQPVIAALRVLEVDIWRVASKVLTPAEQQDLRALIRAWRRQHPAQTAFAYIRFSDFAEERQAFTLAESEKAGGLFKSVQEATQKVDDIRLVAERAIYLATRMPLLFGGLTEVWVSRWLERPELVQLRGEVTQVSGAVERAVQQVEQMPDNVQKIRQALMQDMTGDAAGHPGVLPGVEQTLTAGSALATAVTGAVQALDTYTSGASQRLAAAGKQPADVADLRALMGDVAQAAQHLQGLTESLNAFLLSPGWEQRLPQLLQVLDRSKGQGEELVKYTLARTLFSGLILLAAFLVSTLIAGFILIPYIARRFPGLSARTSSVNAPRR